MSQDNVAVGQLYPEHRVRQELDHFAFYFNCVFPRHVKISGSSFVIKTVCSKWADGIPSAVEGVPPPSRKITAPGPQFNNRPKGRGHPPFCPRPPPPPS